MLSLLLTLVVPPTTLICWSLISLRSNIKKARQIGLPILIRYITPTNPLWMFFGSTLVRLARRLRLAAPDSPFSRFYLFGWDANERYRVHADHGDAFTLVAPGGTWIYVAAPAPAWDVLRRPKAFGRNVEQLAVLNVYGKNLSTTEGAEWQKHRRITAATFTERNNELVWLSALAQGTQMLEYWRRRAPAPVRSTADDCKTFSLNVLAAALFSKPYRFKGREEAARHNTTATPADDFRQYRDSLSTILRGIIPIAIFGGETLRKAWMPVSMQAVGQAVADFRAYVVDLLDRERAHIQQGASTSPSTSTSPSASAPRKDLVSALVHASLADPTITEQDIVSNTFVYAFAGNDTTAITLAHALVNLAANPAVQDWIREEIRMFCKGPPEEWPYATWKELRRCQAVVLETLRLTHPLGSSSKLTKETITLTVGNTTYTLPPNTNVQVNFCALHTNTSVWDSNNDALVFNPHRFIIPSAGAGPASESLRAFADGEFIPWSHGERVCPGKRFSQVELAAVLAVLFRDAGVEVVPEVGETVEDARKRAQGVSLDIQMTLLNEMWRPERVGLRWVGVGVGGDGRV